MKRKNYEKPTIKVVQLQHRTGLLAGSNGGLSGQDYRKSNDDPFEDE